MAPPADPFDLPAFINPYMHDTVDIYAFLELGLAGAGLAMAAEGMEERIRELARSLGTAQEPWKFGWTIAPETLKRNAPIVARHEAAGFCHLFENAAVRMWALLESLVSDAAAHRLLYDDALWDRKEVLALKGSLVEFWRASPEERAEMTVEKLMVERNARRQRGVGRLEAVLEPVGLGGPVSERPRRYLLELSEIRNVIVHCNGIADARLVERCPWIPVLVGEPIGLDTTIVHAYADAARWYVLELDRRWSLLLGSSQTDDYRRMREAMDRELEYCNNIRQRERESPSPKSA